jgi:hypothetical protein
LAIHNVNVAVLRILKICAFEAVCGVGRCPIFNGFHTIASFGGRAVGNSDVLRIMAALICGQSSPSRRCEIVLVRPKIRKFHLQLRVYKKGWIGPVHIYLFERS